MTKRVQDCDINMAVTKRIWVGKESGVYSIKGCNGEEGVLITCPPPPRPVVTKMTQME